MKWHKYGTSSSFSETRRTLVASVCLSVLTSVATNVSLLVLESKGFQVLRQTWMKQIRYTATAVAWSSRAVLKGRPCTSDCLFSDAWVTWTLPSQIRPGFFSIACNSCTLVYVAEGRLCSITTKFTLRRPTCHGICRHNMEFLSQRSSLAHICSSPPPHPIPRRTEREYSGRHVE